MKKQINVVYNPIISQILTFFNGKIYSQIINGIPYLVSEKQIRKARITLRAKIPVKYLTFCNKTFNYEDLEMEIQSSIKNKLMSFLTFSAQEIFILLCIFHLYLANYTEINFKQIHSEIRKMETIKKDNIIDSLTVSAYKLAVGRLLEKIISVEIEECNSRLYGASNKVFTQNLLQINKGNFNLGKLLDLISLSNQYSELYMPEAIFNCRFNQMAHKALEGF